MKLKREDIEKYGTKDEIKLLEMEVDDLSSLPSEGEDDYEEEDSGEGQCPVCGTEEMDSISNIEGEGDFNRLSSIEARVAFECANGHTFYKYYDLEYVRSEAE